MSLWRDEIKQCNKKFRILQIILVDPCVVMGTQTREEPELIATRFRTQPQKMAPEPQADMNFGY